MSDQTAQPQRKPFGRTQRIAIWCYGVTALIAVVPIYVTLTAALVKGDMDAAVAAIDRSITFVEAYGLRAVAYILVAAGVIKSARAVAGAVASRRAAQPPAPSDTSPRAPSNTPAAQERAAA